MKNQDKVISVVCDTYGISRAEFESQSKVGNLPEARQIASHILMEKYDYSSGQAAALYNRDGSSVRRAKSKIKFRIQRYPAVAQRYNEIIAQL